MWLSDEEYTFQQDIKEKKSAGRGAFHKKGGSKSKRCTLPSDYMTKKERAAMNGEVFSYNPNKFYSWEEFKAMPMEYQVKYVNSLLNRYDCGLSNISEIVFEKSPGTLTQHFNRRKQLQYINNSNKHGGSSCLKACEKLRADMKKAMPPDPEEIQNGSNPADKLDEAASKIKLLSDNGVPMPAGKVVEIYKETAGVLITDIQQEAIQDPTDVKEFSMIMNHMDFDILHYIGELFMGKNIVVSIQVKQV